MFVSVSQVCFFLLLCGGRVAWSFEFSGSSDRGVCRAFEHVVGCVDGVRRHDTLAEVHRSWLACRVVVSVLIPDRVFSKTARD